MTDLKACVKFIDGFSIPPASCSLYHYFGKGRHRCTGLSLFRFDDLYLYFTRRKKGLAKVGAETLAYSDITTSLPTLEFSHTHTHTHLVITTTVAGRLRYDYIQKC